MNFIIFSALMFLAAFVCFMIDEMSSPSSSVGGFFGFIGEILRIVGACLFFVWLVYLGVSAAV